MPRLLIFGLLVLATTACSESTYVSTQPPGAGLWVNDVFVGKTPVEYVARRSEFVKPQRYHLELVGYRPHDGEFSKRIATGRIIGGGFSLGISMLFKRPMTFRDQQHIVMSPLPPADEAPPVAP